MTEAESAELVGFLKRCLNEDEQIAKACSKHKAAEHWHWVWSGGPRGTPGDGVTDVPVDLDDPNLQYGVLQLDHWSPAGLRSVEEYPANEGRWSLPTFVLGEIDEVPIVSARHIVQHDPHSVLADIEAKRRIIALYESDAKIVSPDYWVALGEALEALASAYRHRPGFNPSWAPEEAARG